MSDINGAFFVMFRLFPVIFGLFFLTVTLGLDPGVSSLLCSAFFFFCHVRACPGHLFLDSRVKHGDDSIIFSSVILGQAQRVPGISGLSGQARQ